MTITRHLTSGEIALAQSVYGNTINYSIVLVSNGAFVPFQADYTAVTPNGNIYFNQSYLPDFSNPALSLSDRAFFMTQGAGLAIDFSRAAILNQLSGLTAGQSISLNSGTYDRPPGGVEPDEVTVDFYHIFGTVSNEAYVYGGSSAVIRVHSP